MKHTLLAVILFFITGSVIAQPYYFSQSTSGYTPLTGETVVTSSAPWTYASAFTVPIGFSLDFMGANFTTVYVEGSGFTYFDFN